MGPDARIAAFAACQHALVTHAQARGAGLSDDEILVRTRAGRLRRLRRGVYAIGGAPATEEQEMLAAVSRSRRPPAPSSTAAAW